MRGIIAESKGNTGLWLLLRNLAKLVEPFLPIVQGAMFRKVIALLLLPCLLVSQLASLGHAHTGLVASDHGAYNHIHVAVSEHHHEHHGHEHGHDHHGDAGVRSNDQHQSQELSVTLPPTDHDSDAIYIGNFEAFSTSRVVLSHKLDTSSCWALPSLFSPIHHAPLRGSGSSLPLVVARYSCPLYLQHLSLLI